MTRLICIMLTLLFPHPGMTLPPETLRSVVSVLPVWPGLPQGGSGAPPGTAPEGSGIAITENLIVTASHVIGNASRIDIRLEDGRILPAELVARDIATDIALLHSAIPVPPIPIAARPKLADPVCAIGNAFGLGLSVSCGVVSALNVTNAGFNQIEDFVQTDAAVNPGSSGGALVNGNGELVGMLSAIFASGADSNLGINFAVSSHLLLAVVSDLSCYGEVLRTSAGWQLVAPSRSQLQIQPGMVVAEMDPQSMIADAGVLSGDLLVGIGDRVIHSQSDAVAALELFRSEESFDLILLRDGLRIVLQVQQNLERDTARNSENCYLPKD